VAERTGAAQAAAKNAAALTKAAKTPAQKKAAAAAVSRAQAAAEALAVAKTAQASAARAQNAAEAKAARQLAAQKAAAQKKATAALKPKDKPADFIGPQRGPVRQPPTGSLAGRILNDVEPYCGAVGANVCTAGNLSVTGGSLVMAAPAAIGAQTTKASTAMRKGATLEERSLGAKQMNALRNNSVLRTLGSVGRSEDVALLGKSMGVVGGA
jgi:hypothetical protein